MENNSATRIALIGLMGSGKTSTGAELVKMLPGYQLIDMDAEIEKSENKTIAEIFETQGEAYFRKKESELLEQLSKKSKIVLSTGGGVVIDPKNMEKIQNKFVCFYLEVSAEWVLKRIGTGANRPLLKNLSEDQKRDKIEQLRLEREAAYIGASHHMIDSDDKTPLEVAKEIKEILDAEYN